MVFYKPTTDTEKIKALFPNKPLPDGFILGAYEAIENEKCVGKCFVMTDGYKCFVSDISAENDDPLLCEGLVRAALNFSANRNAYMAYCREEKFKNVLISLGFQKNDGLYEGDIPTLLQGSCCKRTENIDIKP